MIASTSHCQRVRQLGDVLSPMQNASMLVASPKSLRLSWATRSARTCSGRLWSRVLLVRNTCCCNALVCADFAHHGVFMQESPSFLLLSLVNACAEGHVGESFQHEPPFLCSIESGARGGHPITTVGRWSSRMPSRHRRTAPTTLIFALRPHHLLFTRRNHV